MNPGLVSCMRIRVGVRSITKRGSFCLRIASTTLALIAGPAGTAGASGEAEDDADRVAGELLSSVLGLERRRRRASASAEVRLPARRSRRARAASRSARAPRWPAGSAARRRGVSFGASVLHAPKNARASASDETRARVTGRNPRWCGRSRSAAARRAGAACRAGRECASGKCSPRTLQLPGSLSKIATTFRHALERGALACA